MRFFEKFYMGANESGREDAYSALAQTQARSWFTAYTPVGRIDDKYIYEFIGLFTGSQGYAISKVVTKRSFLEQLTDKGKDNSETVRVMNHRIKDMDLYEMVQHGEQLLLDNYNPDAVTSHEQVILKLMKRK